MSMSISGPFSPNTTKNCLLETLQGIVKRNSPVIPQTFRNHSLHHMALLEYRQLQPLEEPGSGVETYEASTLDTYNWSPKVERLGLSLPVDMNEMRYLVEADLERAGPAS